MRETFKIALEEIREVYAGLEGFASKTCPEGYLQYKLKEMYLIAVEALKKGQLCPECIEGWTKKQDLCPKCGKTKGEG